MGKRADGTEKRKEKGKKQINSTIINKKGERRQKHQAKGEYIRKLFSRPRYSGTKKKGDEKKAPENRHRKEDALDEARWFEKDNGIQSKNYAWTVWNRGRKEKEDEKIELRDRN